MRRSSTSRFGPDCVKTREPLSVIVSKPFTGILEVIWTVVSVYALPKDRSLFKSLPYENL
jgi:hypothetical protein